MLLRGSVFARVTFGLGARMSQSCSCSLHVLLLVDLPVPANPPERPMWETILERNPGSKCLKPLMYDHKNPRVGWASACKGYDAEAHVALLVHGERAGDALVRV